MPASENNTTFVSADNSSLLGKELEFLTVDAGEELANHLLKNETLNAIENTIASLGYDANDTPADAKVYEKLDLCCKVPGK